MNDIKILAGIEGLRGTNYRELKEVSQEAARMAVTKTIDCEPLILEYSDEIVGKALQLELNSLLTRQGRKNKVVCDMKLYEVEETTEAFIATYK